MRRILRAVLSRLDVLLVAVLAVGGTVPFGRIFVDHSFLLPVVGGAVVALIVSLVMSPRRGSAVTVVVGVLAAVLYLAFASFHMGAPTTSGLRAVWDGTAQSWSGLLTATIPAVASARLTALPVLLAWAATFVGSELCIRSRTVCGPIIPPLGVLLVALSFTAKLGDEPILYPVAFCVVLLVVVFVRANGLARLRAAPSENPARLERSVGSRRALVTYAVPGLALVGVTVLAAGAVIPAPRVSSRFDLRDHYHPPVLTADSVTPLSEVGPQRGGDTKAPLFAVRFKEVPPDLAITRVPVAILDQYDGASWGTDATFALVGTRLPPGPTSDLPTTSVIQDYTIDQGYSSSFLPALDRPVALRGSGIGFDRVSGMLALSGAVKSGFQYSVASEVPDTTAAVLSKRSARPGNDPSVATLALGPAGISWPSAIEAFSSQFPKTGSVYSQLAAIEREFQSPDFAYKVNARAGHNLGVLEDFLSPAPLGNGFGHFGADEQFAAAFAVVARVRGLPSRVVVGYSVDPSDVRSGRPVQVMPSDMHAWAEVNLNGIGWVPFDPVGSRLAAASGPRQTPPVSTTVAPPPTVPPTPNSALTVPARGGGARPTWLVLLPVTALALFLLSVLTAKLSRRRRRRRGTSAQRIVGAWLEIRDRLRSLRVPVTQAMTVREATVVCREALGPELASELARIEPIIDAALYAPDPPDEAKAAAAWASEHLFARAARERTSARRRVLGALDPRSLVGSGRRDGTR